MALPQHRLPKRFPIGTRYVIEGKRGRAGRLHISMRYLEFPDGRHVDLPIDPAHAARAQEPSRRRSPMKKRVEKKFECAGTASTPPR